MGEIYRHRRRKVLACGHLLIVRRETISTSTLSVPQFYQPPICADRLRGMSGNIADLILPASRISSTVSTAYPEF